MILLGTFLAMFAVGIWLSMLPRGEMAEFAGFILSVIGGLLFVFSLITIPIERMSTQSDIREFREIASTAERMREREHSWEAAAFQQKVADRNVWLRSKQYYNGTVFDLWIPDEVERMKPIQ